MTYVEPVHRIAEAQNASPAVISVLTNLMAYIEQKHWQGACHACASVLYVALSECGLAPRICIGECRYGLHGIPFDHSWIELDGAPYDLACAMSLDNGKPICPPVIGGIDVTTGKPTSLRYGIDYRGLDMEGEVVRMFPFADYMDGYPNDPKGLWVIVGICLGNNDIDVDCLRERYAHVRRAYIRRSW